MIVNITDSLLMSCTETWIPRSRREEFFRGGGENEITRREMSNGEKVRREEDLPCGGGP